MIPQSVWIAALVIACLFLLQFQLLHRQHKCTNNSIVHHITSFATASNHHADEMHDTVEYPHASSLLVDTESHAAARMRAVSRPTSQSVASMQPQTEHQTELVGAPQQLDRSVQMQSKQRLQKIQIHREQSDDSVRSLSDESNVRKLPETSRTADNDTDISQSNDATPPPQRPSEPQAFADSTTAPTTDASPPVVIANNEHSPRGVIVVGMHRSSTSYLVRLLHQHLGLGRKSFTTPSYPFSMHTSNYEFSVVNIINDRILSRLGASWHSLNSTLETYSPECFRNLVMSSAIRNLYDDAPFVFKDPRFCLLLHHWLPCFPQEPIIVFPVRHPFEVAQSHKTRDSMTFTDGIRLWYHYNSRALQQCVSVKHCMIIETRFINEKPHDALIAMHRQMREWQLFNLSDSIITPELIPESIVSSRTTEAHMEFVKSISEHELASIVLLYRTLINKARSTTAELLNQAVPQQLPFDISILQS